jgi:hypothetical protein
MLRRHRGDGARDPRCDPTDRKRSAVQYAVSIERRARHSSSAVSSAPPLTTNPMNHAPPADRMLTCTLRSQSANTKPATKWPYGVARHAAILRPLRALEPRSTKLIARSSISQCASSRSWAP